MKICTLCQYNNKHDNCSRVMDEDSKVCRDFKLSDKKVHEHDKRVINKYIKLRKKRLDKK